MYPPERPKRLLIILGLLTLAQTGQVVYRRGKAAEYAHSRLARDYHHSLALSRQLSTQLRDLQLETGVVWAGELQQADAHHSGSYDTSAPQRVIDEELQTADHKFRGRLTLHECLPGSTTCMSGGSLMLQDEHGNDVLDCQLTLLNPDGTSHYELRWDERFSEHDKLTILRDAIGSAANAESASIKSVLGNLYNAGDLTDRQQRRSMIVELFTGVLRKALRDRMQRLK